METLIVGKLGQILRPLIHFISMMVYPSSYPKMLVKDLQSQCAKPAKTQFRSDRVGMHLYPAARSLTLLELPMDHFASVLG